MLGTVLNWLGGGILKQLTDPLLAAYQAKLNAENDTQKIEAERQIAFWERQVDAAREGTQRQAFKMNQPVFWFIMCVALLPGLGTFLLLASTMFFGTRRASGHNHGTLQPSRRHMTHGLR